MQLLRIAWRLDYGLLVPRRPLAHLLALRPAWELGFVLRGIDKMVLGSIPDRKTKVKYGLKCSALPSLFLSGIAP